MEWLRNLAAESKARHLAAKQEEMKREKEERMRLEEAQAQAINNQRDSFLFRKTLVGYQGDLATIKDADENNKAVEESNIPTVSTKSKVDNPYTPERPLPSTKGTDSCIKSILKKSSAIKKTKALGDDMKKPSAAKSLQMKDIGTPVRSVTKKPFENLKSPPARKTQFGLSSTRQVEKTTEKSVKWADEHKTKLVNNV